MSYPSLATVKKLFALSMNYCASPKCETGLICEGSVVGEICHIKGKKKGSTRYDHSQTDKERDAFENLILMCSVHHKVIDDDPVSYSVERLEQLKQGHEAKSLKPFEISDEECDLAIMQYLQKLLDKTEQIHGNTEKLIGIASGGDTYPSAGFHAIPRDGRNTIYMMLRGEFPLDHLSIRLYDMGDYRPRSGLEMTAFLGNESNGVFRSGPYDTALDNMYNIHEFELSGEARGFDIEYKTKYNTWNQKIRLKKTDDGTWKRAYLVIGKGAIELYRHVDPEFPDKDEDIFKYSNQR